MEMVGMNSLGLKEECRLLDSPLGHHEHGEQNHRAVGKLPQVNFRQSALDPPELPAAEGNLKQDDGVEQDAGWIVLPGSQQVAMPQRDEAPRHSAAGAVHSGHPPKAAEFRHG